MNIEATIREVQRALNLDVDGKAGPATWTAIRGAILPKTTAVGLPAKPPQDDARSLRLIATLLPAVQPYAFALVKSARGRGIDCRVISATRTAAEQDALYAQGRTKPGPKVTNARAGFSNHNFGIAFDVGIFQGTRYLEESPLYKVVGSIGQDLGLEWGGSWKSLVDEPHFQLRPAWAVGMPERQMLAELREGRKFA